MQSHDQIGPQRYRESFGRYYDDFNVGDVYEHRPGRTITESDNTWFTLLTMNTHPLHFDKVYAAKSEFKQPLVNSCLTLSMVVGMSVSDISQKAIGNLGWNDIKLSAPVFVGDTHLCRIGSDRETRIGLAAGPGPCHRPHDRQEGGRHAVHRVSSALR